MTEPVKSKRPYDSHGRRRRAQAGRAAVLEAARNLFLERGYPATTMSSVARQAGVSVETIYKSIGNKPALLKAVLDVAIAGDDEPVPMLQRDLVARMRTEPDPRLVLSLYGEHIITSWPRQMPLQLIARAAAAVEPTAAQLWEEIQAERLAGMTVFAEELARRGFLRPGSNVDQARDILWTLTAPEQYEVLVLQRGWSMARVATFIVDAMKGTLLPAR